jgi:hypothetical protein
MLWCVVCVRHVHAHAMGRKHVRRAALARSQRTSAHDYHRHAHACAQVSQKRAKRKREAGESALKAAGVTEFRAALEAAARDRVVIERWGANVSLAVMEALSRASALETRSEAEARGGNKKRYFPKRRVTRTWLLAEGARAKAYEQVVGITDVAHRALLRETEEERKTAEVYDAKKMFFYFRLIITAIAEHLSEGEERPTITAEHLDNLALPASICAHMSQYRLPRCAS